MEGREETRVYRGTLTGNVHDLGLLEDPAGESRILGPASQLPAVVVLAEDQGQLADRGIAPLRGGHVRVAYHLPAQPPHHPCRGRAPPRLATRRDRPIRVDLLLRKNDLDERRFHWKPEIHTFVPIITHSRRGLEKIAGGEDRVPSKITGGAPHAPHSKPAYFYFGTAIPRSTAPSKELKKEGERTARNRWNSSRFRSLNFYI